MKKILFTILTFFVLTISVKSQFGITQNIGSGATLVRVPTPGGFQASLINRNFSDTTSANLTPISFYPGAQIFTTGDTSIWVRSVGALKWIKISGSTGGGVITGANNGLTLSGSTVGLDGALVRNTSITGGSFTFSVSATGASIGLANAKIGMAADSINMIVTGQGASLFMKPTLSYFGAGNVGIGTATPGSLLSIARSNIQTQNDSNGIILTNTGFATGTTTQQLGLNISWIFQAWKNTPTQGSRQLRFRLDAYPAAFNAGTWRLSFALDSTTQTYKPTMTMKSNGEMFIYTDSATTRYGNLNNVAVGGSGGVIYLGSQPAIGASTSSCIGIGGNVLTSASLSGTLNTAIGYNSMQVNTSGAINTAVGYNSMNANTTGYSNAAFGNNAMLNLTTGFQNAAGGAGVYENMTTGQENTGFGYDAGLNCTTCIRNVHLGWNAKTSTDGLQNVAIGYQSGSAVTAGNSNNVFIGYNAGADASQIGDADNTVSIGASSYTTADNQVVIGNSSMTQFNFWGALMPGGSAGTSGQVLTSAGANASPTWATPSSGGITIGTTTITSGTNTKVLFNNSGVAGEYTITGSGNVAMSASPTFTGTANAAAIAASGDITSLTKIGIGTASPSQGLEIKSTGLNADGYSLNSNILVTDTRAQAAGVGGGIAFRGFYDGTAQATMAGGIFAYKTNGTDLNSGFDMRFATREDGSGNVSTRMTIKGSGEVGIGTTTPATKLDVSGSVSANHIVGNTSAPTIAAGTGAGTSPTVSVGSGSTDIGGYVNITTGTVPTGTNATIATITFNVAYTAAPHSIILYPANALTATLSGVAMVFVDQAAISTTTFTIVSGTTALTGSSSYKWFFTVVQ